VPAGREAQSAVARSSVIAARQGVVEDARTATPLDRCVGLYLDAWDRQPQNRPRWMSKATDRSFADEVCRRAAAEDALRRDGFVPRRTAQPIEAAVLAELTPP
jgi:hypothetical protein